MRDHRQFVVATLFSISPDAQFTVGDDYESLRWHNQDITKPTKEEFEAKLAFLKKEEPMRLLRQQRDQKLSQSDWMAVSDRTMTPEQISYRQSLRDMPAHYPDVALNDAGELINVTWPTKPQ